jgi:hypothetical protein
MRGKVTEAPAVKEEVTVHIHVPKESKIPFDMKGMEIGKAHSMTIRGPIRSLSKDEYGESMSMKIEGIDSESGGGSSLGDAMKEAKRKRRFGGNV